MLIKITIDGQDYHANNTLGAQLEFAKRTGKDVSALANVKDADGGINYETLELMGKFIWCCIASACRKEGRQFPIPFEQFSDYLDIESLTDFTNSLSEGNK